MRQLTELKASDTIEVEIYPPEGEEPAIIVHTKTFATTDWMRAKHKHKYLDQTTVTKDGSILVENDLSKPQLKALSELVVSIEGVDLEGMTPNELYLNPAYSKFPDTVWVALKKHEQDDKKN